jgi:transposase
MGGPGRIPCRGQPIMEPGPSPASPASSAKHDRYDATQLARLCRAGELTAVRVPSDAEERIRDVVRCRETLQRELLRSRHYLLKFLAPRGRAMRNKISRGCAAPMLPSAANAGYAAH